MVIGQHTTSKNNYNIKHATTRLMWSTHDYTIEVFAVQLKNAHSYCVCGHLIVGIVLVNNWLFDFSWKALMPTSMTSSPEPYLH